jgi:hypothetical protein
VPGARVGQAKGTEETKGRRATWWRGRWRPWRGARCCSARRRLPERGHDRGHGDLGDSVRGRDAGGGERHTEEVKRTRLAEESGGGGEANQTRGGMEVTHCTMETGVNEGAMGPREVKPTVALARLRVNGRIGRLTRAKPQLYGCPVQARSRTRYTKQVKIGPKSQASDRPLNQTHPTAQPGLLI